MKKLGEDVLDGVKTTYVGDGDILHIQKVQDVEPFIEANKEHLKSTPKELAHKQSVFKVGTIPNVFVDHFMKHGINLYHSEEYDANAACRYILSHPSMAHFKCYSGNVRRSVLPVWVKNALDKAIEEISRRYGYN